MNARDKAKLMRRIDRAFNAAIDAESLAQNLGVPSWICTRIGTVWYELDVVRGSIEALTREDFRR
jgi:hypothetical protein